MRKIFSRRLVLASLLVVGLGLPAAAEEVTVFAAASLSNVLKEIGATYQPSTGDKLVFNFDGSNTLARQISEGAPVDLFFSADEMRMDQLEKKGRIASGTRRSLLSNTLVAVTSKGGGVSVKGPQDLQKIRVLALAEPQSVPAGIYAKEYLKSVDLWSSVIDKIIPTDNVRGALAAVEAGNADAAIVYKTDALLSQKVEIAFEVPAAEGPKISYPLGVIAGAKAEAGARRFADYLAGAEARAAFEKYGFLTAAP